MATKTSETMDAMMRGRRKEMMNTDLYTPPADEETTESKVESDAEPVDEATGKFQVIAPGEPDAQDKFNYEPLVDMPGAWAVYPPGVPCDPAEYRVALEQPAGANDFTAMQSALDEASGVRSDPGPMSNTDTVAKETVA